MKITGTKYAATCLLIYTAVLSVIMFWRVNSLPLSLLAVAAGAGWGLWWLERFAFSNRAGRAALGPAGAGSVLNYPRAENREDEAAPIQASGDAIRSEQAHYMAAQARLALAEAEQAVSLSIEAFNNIVFEAGEVARCTCEMTDWDSGNSPLMREALARLTEKGNHIRENAQIVVIAFQFHDLLRQRLERIAAYLETAQAADAGQREAAAQAEGRDGVHRASLPFSAVSYLPKQDNAADITLF